MLPDWIDAKEWAEYEKSRKAKRVPFTDHAKDLIVRKLAAWKKIGHDPNLILQNSTEQGWTGVFEPKPSGFQSNSKPFRSQQESNAPDYIDATNIPYGMTPSEFVSQQRARANGGAS